MHCENCGKKNNDDSQFCNYCGKPLQAIQEAKSVKSNQREASPNSNKGRGLFLTLMILVATVFIGGIMLGSVYFSDIISDGFSDDIKVPIIQTASEGISSATQELMSFFTPNDPYEKINTDIEYIEAPYLNNDGLVSLDDVDTLLSEVYDYVEPKIGKGKIVYAEKNTLCVYLKFIDNTGYVYIPNVEGIEAGGKGLRVATMQPNLADFAILGVYDEFLKEPLKKIDGAGTKIDRFSIDHTFIDNGMTGDDDYDNKEVFYDALRKLSAYSVIIWEGHGANIESLGSVLLSGVQFTEEFYKKYEDDFKQLRLLKSNGEVVITPKYFDHYIPKGSLDGAIIYLGACESGVDKRLLQVFFNKGAVVVFANSGIIHTDYNANMIGSVFDALTIIGPNGPVSTEEALEIAKRENGATDSGWATAGDELIWIKDTEVQHWSKPNFDGYFLLGESSIPVEVGMSQSTPAPTATPRTSVKPTNNPTATPKPTTAPTPVPVEVGKPTPTPVEVGTPPVDINLDGLTTFGYYSYDGYGGNYYFDISFNQHTTTQNVVSGEFADYFGEASIWGTFNDSVLEFSIHSSEYAIRYFKGNYYPDENAIKGHWYDANYTGDFELYTK